MYKSRSPFQVPQIPGSSIRRKQEQRARFQMSIQKPKEQQKTRQLLKPTNLSAVSSLPSQMDEQQPIQTDDEIFWEYEISNQVSNQASRKIVFREQQYYVRSTGNEQIFQTVYITAQNILGLKDRNGSSTTRICALHLTQINSIIDDAQTKTYDLLYKQTQDFSWQIPMNLSQLRLGIQFDDTIQSGPLTVPLVCQFDIRHTSR